MYRVSFYNNIIFVNYYSLVIVSLIIIVFYFVSHIFNTLHKHNIILLAIFDTVKVNYTLEELEDLSLAYAISVHKAQGGEFDVVVMPFTFQHYIMLRRKLIYTGVTRAKKTLIMVGDVAAMQQGIKRIEANRKTILKEKLIEFIKNDSSPSIKQQLIEEDSLGETFSELDPDDFKNL